MADRQGQDCVFGISGGGAVHLVDVYAHNAVTEIIHNARTVISNERGRFALPSEFMDRLVMDCGRWVLDSGPHEAERAVRGRINDFLDQRERLRHEENERKVKKSLGHAPAESPLPRHR